MYKEFIWGGQGVGAWENRRREGRGVLKEWEFFPILGPDFFFLLFLCTRSLFSLIEPFTTINSASHHFNFQYSDQSIFLRQTSRIDHQTIPRSDHHIPVPHQTILRPDNQIRPSDQTVTTIPGHQIRSSQKTTILD